MKNTKWSFVIIAFMIGILIPASVICQESIDIQVSPNVLNLQNNGEVVTIHTDIPFSQVSASSVSLNGIEIESWKADNQGYFVAKFNMDEVKKLEDLEIGGYNTLTLSGLKTTGETFSGSDEILVVNNIPKGK